MQRMLKNFLASSKPWKKKIRKLVLSFTKTSLVSIYNRHSQKTGRRREQNIWHARLSPRGDLLIGALNPHTGDVVYQLAARSSHCIHFIHRFANAIQTLNDLIQDNRAIHFHANLWQPCCHRRKPVPGNWSDKPSKKIGELEKLPIEISQRMPLGPIRLRSCGDGRGSVIHLHRLSNDFSLHAKFKGGSLELLHYVGLLPN